MSGMPNTMMSFGSSHNALDSSIFSQFGIAIKFFGDSVSNIIAQLGLEEFQRKYPGLIPEDINQDIPQEYDSLPHAVQSFFRKLESTPSYDRGKIPVHHLFSAGEYSDILTALVENILSSENIEFLFSRMFIMFSEEKYSEFYPTLDDKKKKLLHFFSEQAKLGEKL